MAKMRAKMRVANAHSYEADGKVTQETLIMYCVAKHGSYPVDGSDEDNTFARWTPNGRLELMVANPNLFGAFKVGEEYYLDFTQAK